MRREGTKAGPTRTPPTRSPLPRSLSAGFTPLAILILLAQLLVAEHTVAHFSDSPLQDAPQHCAICSFGGHSAGVSAAVPTASVQALTWIAWFSSPQSPPTRFLDGATLARAPPFAHLIATSV